MRISSNNPIKIVYSNVIHERKTFPQNFFSYKCISVLINLEKITSLKYQNPLFSIKRFNLYSWYPEDHGDMKGNLIEWAKRKVVKLGGDPSGGIFLHCFPRIMGHVFNPLSVYFCYNKSKVLSALIYEVRNTVGGIHSYVGLVENEKDFHLTKKHLPVSPFLPEEGSYKLLSKLENDRIKISVDMMVNNKSTLLALQLGKIKDLTSSSLFYGIINGSALPGKPIIGILFQALKLWLKGAIYKKIISNKEHTISKAKKG